MIVIEITKKYLLTFNFLMKNMKTKYRKKRKQKKKNKSIDK